MTNRFMQFVAGFMGMATPDLQLRRYTVKWSTKDIRGQNGFNWAKHAARSNFARGIP